MAREIQITPKRISYAQQKENELYANLMKVVNAKQQELAELIDCTIQEMKDEVTQTSDRLNVYDNLNLENYRENAQVATAELQRIVLMRLGEKVAKQLVNSVNCLRETFVGTLQRCLESLEKSYEHDTSLTGDYIDLHNRFYFF